jgi:hypothetical protein
VSRLLALLLASTLAASAANAAEPTCDEDATAEQRGEPSGDDCGDCDDGCLECACCRVPLAVELRTARSTPPLARGNVPSDRAALEGLRPPSEIFQPPRA